LSARRFLSVSKHEVEQFFSGCGSIANIWIAQKPPGFAFAEFLTAEDAEAAVAACDGKELHGRRIKVEVSNTTHKPGMPREGRGGGFRGGFGGPQADFGRGPPEQAYGRDYGRDRAPDYRNDYRDSRSDRDRSDRDRDVSAQETTRWTLHCTAMKSKCIRFSNTDLIAPCLCLSFLSVSSTAAALALALLAALATTIAARPIAACVSAPRSASASATAVAPPAATIAAPPPPATAMTDARRSASAARRDARDPDPDRDRPPRLASAAGHPS